MLVYQLHSWQAVNTALYVYICVYIYVCVCVCVCVYIYILLFALLCKYCVFFYYSCFIIAHIKIYFFFYQQNLFVKTPYSPAMLDKQTFTLLRTAHFPPNAKC